MTVLKWIVHLVQNSGGGGINVVVFVKGALGKPPNTTQREKRGILGPKPPFFGPFYGKHFRHFSETPISAKLFCKMNFR